MKHTIFKTSLLMTSALAATMVPVAYDPGKNGWKVDADGKLELKDGNPIYIDSNGAEMTVEQGTIARLNGEAKSNREALQEANTKLKTFEGIDPAKAREDAANMAKIDSKTLIDAGEVDRVKEEIKTQFTGQISELQAALDASNGTIDSMTLSTAFSNSQFIKDNIAIPADMFQASMVDKFKVKDGKLVALDGAGNVLMSKKRVGENATFDEALAIHVENRADKESLLKEPPKSGTNNTGAGGNNGGNTAKITSSEYKAMNKHEMVAAGVKLAAGELEVVPD